jgi:hypothetical protein
MATPAWHLHQPFTESTTGPRVHLKLSFSHVRGVQSLSGRSRKQRTARRELLSGSVVHLSISTRRWSFVGARIDSGVQIDLSSILDETCQLPALLCPGVAPDATVRCPGAEALCKMGSAGSLPPLRRDRIATGSRCTQTSTAAPRRVRPPPLLQPTTSLASYGRCGARHSGTRTGSESQAQDSGPTHSRFPSSLSHQPSERFKKRGVYFLRGVNQSMRDIGGHLKSHKPALRVHGKLFSSEGCVIFPVGTSLAEATSGCFLWHDGSDYHHRPCWGSVRLQMNFVISSAENCELQAW